jgi:23S rRNA (cytosine1962-C5)-methyltransferase
MATFTLAFPQRFEAYELLDCGHGRKLERFGDYVLIRPEPQALWPTRHSEDDWTHRAHARFVPEGSHGGKWEHLRKMPDRWQVAYKMGRHDMRLRLALTGFKHVGVFPEQAANWDYIFGSARRFTKPKVLNLFAYTGGATLAARAAGAEVTHVDSVKQILTWANENAALNKWEDIRWLKEDALGFVQREVRRGAKYNGIILDPPAFGHGPKGEKWKLEEQVDELVANVAKLADKNQFFLVMNAYSLGLSALVLEGLMRSHFPQPALQQLEIGELYIPEGKGKRRLPAGVFARLEWNRLARQ